MKKLLFVKQLMICVKSMNRKDKRSTFEIGWSGVKQEMTLLERKKKSNVYDFRFTGVFNI